VVVYEQVLHPDSFRALGPDAPSAADSSISAGSSYSTEIRSQETSSVGSANLSTVGPFESDSSASTPESLTRTVVAAGLTRNSLNAGEPPLQSNLILLPERSGVTPSSPQ